MTDLSRDEILRYSRHLVMPEVTIEGQQKLKNARVLCVGAGGLGSPLTLYLAAAGVGTLGIAEFDRVDLTNIQRQILYSTSDVGRPKLLAASERLSQLNPDIDIVCHDLRLSSENVMDTVAPYDIVVDGTDNFPTRYLVNDACVLSGKPNVYGSIFRFEGQVSVFDASRGPCYRCLFPEPPPPGAVPSCAEGGVLGVLPGIIGSLQALEVIKLILNTGQPLISRLVLFDALAFEFREVKLRKDEDCVICGANPSIFAPVDYEAFCGGAGSSVPTSESVPSITVEEFVSQRDSGAIGELIDVRNPHEYEIVCVPGARLIPLPDLAARLHELDASRPYVITCHRGPRSIQAYHLLRSSGFTRLRVLDGGVDAWAARIDRSMARYG
ncbi:MAG TPA: molybdopterin-synthase adenylyltransferase MoeB [Woeseiaceae bacterium]|nr:molybdopterin-synthase adenylyltransferase MoeB [Woeseiaceae bacterium]